MLPASLLSLPAISPPSLDALQELDVREAQGVGTALEGLMVPRLLSEGAVAEIKDAEYLAAMMF